MQELGTLSIREGRMISFPDVRPLPSFPRAPAYCILGLPNAPQSLQPPRPLQAGSL